MFWPDKLSLMYASVDRFFGAAGIIQLHFLQEGAQF